MGAKEKQARKLKEKAARRKLEKTVDKGGHHKSEKGKGK
jgi:hypothetical protein